MHLVAPRMNGAQCDGARIGFGATLVNGDPDDRR
jgi:hypothetical protein